MSAKLQGQQNSNPGNPKITGEAFGAQWDNDEWIDHVQEAPDAVNEALGWRRRLPRWPEHWRDRWGHRANELEDEGYDWITAEKLAWNEVLEEKKQTETSPTIPMAQTRTQGTFKESA